MPLPHLRRPAATPRARVIRVRSPHLLIATTLLLSATVQAKGLVGWPGSFKTSVFCRTYSCVGATVKPDSLGGSSVTYRLAKLNKAVLIVTSTDDHEIVTAVLNFEGRVPGQLTAAEFQAAAVFFQASTGRKVMFTAADCWQSGRRSIPPTLVDDGEGHVYNVNCTGVRSTDISREQAAALGITPKTLTGFAAEPHY